jgi:predicted MFS family arabinose efflux permease
VKGRAQRAGVFAASSGETATGMFVAFRQPLYLRLWLSSTVVLLGVMAQTVARGWLAFDLTGSNAALGGVLLAFGVALVLATPWGGVVADRWPKRLVLHVSTALFAATSAWIGIAVALGVVAYWMLLAAGEASRVAGPALAGVVIATAAIGVQVVFLACAVLFTGGLVVGLALPPGRRRDGAPARSPLVEMADGISYIAARPTLALLLPCGIGVVMVGLPYLAFLPTVADGIFDAGAVGYGILSASSAVGAVIGGLLLGRRGQRGDEWRLLVVFGIAFGLSLSGLAVAPSFSWAVAVLVPLGACLLAFQTINQSLLLELSDLLYHGRIQGLVMLSFGAFGIAALPLGVLADAIGLRQTLAGMGGGVIVIMVVFAVLSHRHWGQTTLRDLG